MTNNDPILQQKFEKLFKEHFTALCYFAKKYLGDLDTSKEVAHSVFIKIWENRAEFDFDKPAKSYLFTSVYNRSLNVLRDNKKFSTTDDEYAINAELDGGEFHDTMELAELEGRIKRALTKLPDKCREVFELNRFENKKYNEIAIQLNLSLKTVEAHMSKALKILKEELKDYIYLILFLLLKNNDML